MLSFSSCVCKNEIFDENDIHAVTIDNDKIVATTSIDDEKVVKMFVSTFNNGISVADSDFKLNNKVTTKLVFTDINKFEFTHIYLDVKSNNILVVRNNVVLGKWNNEELIDLYLKCFEVENYKLRSRIHKLTRIKWHNDLKKLVGNLFAKEVLEKKYELNLDKFDGKEFNYNVEIDEEIIIIDDDEAFL